MTAKKKMTLYFPETMLKETKREAARLDRSMSWIMQAAWKIAREEMKRYPGIDAPEVNESDISAPWMEEIEDLEAVG